MTHPGVKLSPTLWEREKVAKEQMSLAEEIYRQTVERPFLLYFVFAFSCLWKVIRSKKKKKYTHGEFMSKYGKTNTIL